MSDLFFYIVDLLNFFDFFWWCDYDVLQRKPYFHYFYVAINSNQKKVFMYSILYMEYQLKWWKYHISYIIFFLERYYTKAKYNPKLMYNTYFSYITIASIVSLWRIRNKIHVLNTCILIWEICFLPIQMLIN